MLVYILHVACSRNMGLNLFGMAFEIGRYIWDARRWTFYLGLIYFYMSLPNLWSKQPESTPSSAASTDTGYSIVIAVAGTLQKLGQWFVVMTWVIVKVVVCLSFEQFLFVFRASLIKQAACPCLVQSGRNRLLPIVVDSLKTAQIGSCIAIGWRASTGSDRVDMPCLIANHENEIWNLMFNRWIQLTCVKWGLCSQQ